MQESSNTDTAATPAGPWAMVPIWVLDPDQYLPAVDPAMLKDGDDKPLNGTDMRVYVALRSFAGPDGRCWPNIRTVAERANVGKSTAEKSIGKMRRVGLLASETRYRGDGSISGCVYHLRNDPPMASGAPADSEGDALGSEGGVPQDSMGGPLESEGGTPSNPAGGTPGFGGAGTDQGTDQVNTPSDPTREADLPSLPASPPSPPRGRDRSRPGETERQKPLAEATRAEGLHRVARRGFNDEQTRYLVDDLTARFRPASPAWWRELDDNGTLGDRIAESIERQQQAEAGAGFRPYRNTTTDDAYLRFAEEPAA